MLRLFLSLNFPIIVTSKCFTCSLLLFRKQCASLFFFMKKLRKIRIKCFEAFAVCAAHFLGLDISDTYDRLSHTCMYMYDNEIKKTRSEISLEKWI